MFGKIITLDPANPNQPLVHLYAGRGGRAMATVEGLPADTVALLIFTVPEASAATVIEADENNAIYINGWSLDFIDQVRYEIVARDADGKSTSMGKGWLTVYDSATSGSIPEPPPLIPPDTYIHSDVTGLWYKLTATINELGEPAVATGPGVENPYA